MMRFYKAGQSNTQNERGIALIYYVLILSVLLFFGNVAIRFGKVNRDRVVFQSHVHSALSAGIMAAPGAQDIFLASCHHLKALWLPSLPCAAANFTPWPPNNPTDQSIADYPGPFPSVNGEYSCTNVRMTYTPANPPTIPQPSYCIDATCADQSVILMSSNIRNIGASKCIGAAPVVAYLGIDYSTSLNDTYNDWTPSYPYDEDGNPRSISITPPSFAVLGNDNYFSSTGVPPQGARNFTGTPASITAQVADMQLPGIRQYIDSTGNLTQPVRMPFMWGEIDRKSEHPTTDFLVDSGGTLTFNSLYSALNPDNLTANVWASLPDIAVPSNSNNPNGVPDPIQYISDNPKIAPNSTYLGMQSTMRDWLSGGKCNPDDGDPSNGDDDEGCDKLHSFTRGGHITQNYLANQCYGAFMTIYKQAAEQVLYLFGQNRVRTGVLGFSNWIYPILPLFPEVFFNTVGSPLYNRTVSDNQVQVLGPVPSSLSPPSIVPGNDFVLSQFGDSTKSGGYRLTRLRASALVNAMSFCYRDMAFDVIPGGTEYFTALPNTHNPGMKVKPDHEPDTRPPDCDVDEKRFYTQPMVYGRDGRCYEDLESAPPYPNHYDSGDLVCTYRDITPWNPSWAFPAYTGSASWIQSDDITHPWRWCNVNSQRPNVAIGIHSIAAGQFSKTGLEHEGQSLPFYGPSGPLGDTRYPYNTFGPTTTFTSGAALIAIRALLDPVLAPPGTRKILVLFTDGVPTVSLHNLLSDPTAQTYWFPRNPTQAELPQYSSGTPTPTLSGMLETAHLLQYAASQGITVYLQMVASGSEGPYKEGLLSMLRQPNVVRDPDTNTFAYNFCKSVELQGLAASSSTGNPNQLPGEAPFPATSPQNCDPLNSQFSSGINVLDVTKSTSESYDQFRQRVFSQLGSQLLYEIAQWKHTK